MRTNSILLGGLLAPFQNSARTTRAEFWSFLPFGIGLCVVASLGAKMLGFSFMGVVLSVLIAAIPIVALWWRRLQDVGIAGAHALAPWVSALIFFLAITAAYSLHVQTPFALAEAQSNLWSWLLVPDVLFRFVGGKWVAVAVALISLIGFLFRFVFALSHAMLPSQNTNNRYGPNPNEVPQ